MKERMIALLLAGMLLLTGCGERPIKNEEDVPGGYVEQCFDWPEDFYCTGIYPNADNSVTLLGGKGWQGQSLSGYDPEKGFEGYKGGIQIYDALPDGTLTLRSIPWEEELISLCADTPHQISMAMNEAGQLFVLASEIARMGFTPKEPFQLYKVEKDMLLPIDVDFSGLESDWWDEVPFENSFGSCNLEGVSNDQLFITAGGPSKWAIWDTNGKLHNSFILDTGSAMLIHSIRNGYLWAGQSNDYDLAYTLPDFKSAGRMELPSDGYVFPDYEGNGFYHMSRGFNYDTNQEEEKILSHYTLDGDTREILMHGNDFSWGSSKVWLGGETPDKAFWAITNDMGVQDLYRYAYDPEKSVQNTLTIFSLNGSSSLTKAITLWNQQHPETRIEHIIGNQDAGETAMTQEDVIRQLNAQLLAGDGPDLLILDSLPADALIRQGMLTDLSGLFNLDAVRPNVRAAFETDGKLYGIPTGMSTYIAGGLDGDVDDRILTLEGLADAVEAMPDPQSSTDACLSFVSPVYERLFDFFYPASSADIWADGHFDREGFVNFVQQLNRIAHRNHILTIAGYNQNLQGKESDDSLTGEEAYRMFSLSALNEFWNGNSRWFVHNWVKASSAGSFSRIVKDETGNIIGSDYLPITLSPLPGADQNGVFLPVCTMAIPTSSTQNKDLAVQFIQLMLSDEMQSNPYELDGLPVTQNGLELAFEEVRKREPFVLTTDPQELLNAMSAVTPDPVLWAVLRENAAKLYDGTITEEEACKAIEKAAELRLAEQE